MTFKSCFVEQSILAHTAVLGLRVPCRISLIEHGLNWINHISHVGAQGPLKWVGLRGKTIALLLAVGTASNPKPGGFLNPWASVSDCCLNAF